jgi:endonuclease/exonuclease/phosphatase family metal-dependent hydrolase
MQNLWRLILVLAVFGVFLVRASASEVVRLVTWNMQWFPGKRPQASQAEQDQHLMEILGVLPELRADVIVLQEVRNMEVVQALAKSLPGFQVHVVSCYRERIGEILGIQQIAILSRFEASEAWSEPWKRGWADAPRGFAYAKLNLQGRPLHIYGLHLKSNLGDPIRNPSKREDAVEQLIHHIREHVPSDEAIVAAGDFNTSKDQLSLAGDRTLMKLEEAGFFWSFEGVPFDDRVTVPQKGSYPDACFDHIFVKHLGRPIAQVLKGTPGSDHLPVILDLIIPSMDNK